MVFRLRLIAFGVLILLATEAADARHFRVGFAKQNITPEKPTPLWGYGSRHAALSAGIRDPLFVKAVVIDVGDEKLAIAGLDLGRAPTDAMMKRIRAAIESRSGIRSMLISGSHTHHGPVIELVDEDGKGRGTFDDAVAYARDLEEKVIETIVSAAAQVKDARIGWNSREVTMNRNRHSKLEHAPVDTELGVIRLDDPDGHPIAVLVNYAAHPTMLDSNDLRFSAEWPGAMMRSVEEQLQTHCIFLQGASGDLTTQADEQTRGVDAFGKAMATHVIDIVRQTATTKPQRPRIRSQERSFEFRTRLGFANPLTKAVFGTAFFPELAEASMSEDLLRNTIQPRITTVVINHELALVGGSGEFFCEHALRLKSRSRAGETFFIGYCNGHHMYFPTIEAAAEGGYGADPAVSWVGLGAGEEMLDQALIDLYTLHGKFTLELPTPKVSSGR